ncbi:MAG TPA: hypothetical protein VJM31_17030 [Vicinamibacterales bacterium]|nr:hypothetical protein [Vicinamibacterales bacterium]
MAIPEQKNASDLGQQALALAEQLGRIAGTIEGTAEAWLHRQTLADQLTRVRDGATDMLETLTDGAQKGRKVATGTVASFTQTVRRTASSAMSAARVGRATQKNRKKKGASAVATRRADPAHAAGKKRRKPGPSVAGAKKSDERIPKMRTAAAVRQRRKSYA